MLTRIMYEFYIPLPPSSNMAYANNFSSKGRGRFLTKKAKDWYMEASLVLQSQFHKKPFPLEKYIELFITLKGVTYQSDISNRLKLIEDLLVKCEVLSDDRYVDKIIIERYKDIQGAEYKPPDNIVSSKSARIIVNGLSNVSEDYNGKNA